MGALKGGAAAYHDCPPTKVAMVFDKLYSQMLLPRLYFNLLEGKSLAISQQPNDVRKIVISLPLSI